MTKGGKIVIVLGTIAVLTTGIILFTAGTSTAAAVQQFKFPDFTPEHKKLQEEINWITNMEGDWGTTSKPAGNGVPTNGRYPSLSWMHWDNEQQAMQGIFNEARRYIGPVPNDGWQAYTYPEGIKSYVRCGPKNLGCQIFHKNISVGQAVLVLGGALVTAGTAGFAGPAVAAALISSGAALALKPGDDKTVIAQQAAQYLKDNPDAFKPADTSSSFDGCESCSRSKNKELLLSNDLA